MRVDLDDYTPDIPTLALDELDRGQQEAVLDWYRGDIDLSDLVYAVPAIGEACIDESKLETWAEMIIEEEELDDVC